MHAGVDHETARAQRICGEHADAAPVVLEQRAHAPRRRGRADELEGVVERVFDLEGFPRVAACAAERASGPVVLEDLDPVTCPS